jgi:hypothetical protein
MSSKLLQSRLLRLMLATLLLLTSLSFTWQPTETGNTVLAQSDSQPQLDPPPTFYRPSSNNFVAGRNLTTPNDPINLVAYGPGLGWGDVANALYNSGANWQDNNGPASIDILPIFRRCSNDVTWNPLDGGIPFVHQGASANTPCSDAWFQPPPPSADPLRTKNRYWDYLGPETYIDTVYAAANRTNNWVFDSIGILTCGAAHCIREYNGGRDQMRVDTVLGANSFGWKTKTFNLTGIPVHTNQQDNSPFQGQFATDGTVNVVCLDKRSASVRQTEAANYGGVEYCDRKHAERPMGFNNIAPALGSQLEIGTRFTYTLNIGYSDLNRRISGSGVTVKMNYKTSATTSVTTTIGTSPRLSSPSAGNYSVAFPNIAVPTNAWVDPTTGTSDAFIEIQVTDSFGAVWKYKTLRYILTSVKYDFVFLLDTTGSNISSVDGNRERLASLISGLSTAYPTARYGVAEFGDFDDPQVYIKRTELGTATSTVINDIRTGNLGASTGGAGPYNEANVQALYNAATGFTWRSNQTGQPPVRRVILMFSDVSGSYQTAGTGGGPGVTYATAKTALASNDKNIRVIGLRSGSGATALMNAVTADTGTVNGVIDIGSVNTSSIQQILQATYR